MREFLRRAGAPGARAFVVTVNSARAAERMVAAARKERPDVPVFARARDPVHASRLLKLGAVEVTLEAVEASLQLGARVLEGLGVSDDAIARRLDDMRDAGTCGGFRRGMGESGREAGPRRLIASRDTGRLVVAGQAGLAPRR